MYKKLVDYEAYIKKRAVKEGVTDELIEYHKTMVQHFQHERLIHLIVTMFFALFMIIFFIIFGTIGATMMINLWSNIIYWSMGGIAGISLLTTLFYLRHYYRLENGVQRLEDITRKLYEA